ncbi:COG1470 family protein, partial [Elongatibacter sediminis]
MTILNPGPFFLDETLRVSANIGAGQIRSGSYLDIHGFGFALNCHPGEGFSNCISEGNTVEFLGNMSTDCVDSAGNPVDLLVPESNVIPMTTTSGLPIRTPANTQCNVQFDMAVRELAEGGDRLIVQAMGWPLEGMSASTCDNGLTSSASATIGFFINECGIELDKQVSVDGGQTWSDADTEAGAPQLALGGDAHYRLVIRNTGSIAYNSPISVVDAALGINTTVPALGAGQSTTVTSAQIPALLKTGRCEVVGSLENQSSVTGMCSSGADAVSANASDVAWIECTGAPSIDIEKATNGHDADTPTGPQIPAGDPVTWTYVVTNDGTLPLTSVAVSDDKLGAVSCPKSTLAVGESMTCTANGTAVAGQYSNLGTATATSTGGDVNDSDPSHYFGVQGGIDIEKATNGHDADTPTGPQILVGDPVTWTYVVTNNSNVELTGVAVSDDQLGAISCP